MAIDCVSGSVSSAERTDNPCINRITEVRLDRENPIANPASTYFARLAGDPIHDTLAVRILEYAQLSQPIAHTRAIASIAGRWGFADATHLSRAFRDASGMSPREWRDRGSRRGPAAD